MSSHWFTRLLVGTVAGALFSPTSALADPSARVARVSFIGGSVSFRPGSLDDWNIATLNYPLTVGDHVWVDRAARTELQLGSTAVRIAQLSEFSLLNLDDHTVQLRLTEGAISLRVRALDDQDVVEVDTPNASVSVLRPGLYRVEVNEAGDSSTVTVREGEADVATGTAAFPLRRDQSAVLAGLDSPQPDVRPALRLDDFDDWCLTRDRRTDNLRAAQYVSPETIGYEDLDANGTWQVVPEYGPVWIPRVRAEWVPYRYGRWAWIEPWGWTWIDDAPWGFAPFHYGRWAFLPARGWVWVPGTLVARPVYAPALVAFVGGDSWSVSVRLGNGPVGWFPLGPHEVYVPAYHVTPEYVRRVNLAHVTTINVTNISVANVTYVNRTVPGAITAVPRDAFLQARPVGAVAIAIPREQAQTARVVSVAPVAPQRTSIAGPSRRAATPPAAVVTRQVIVRSAPPPAPAPFAAKETALARRPGEPMSEPTENTAARASQAPSAPHPLVRGVAAGRTAPGAPSPTVASPAPAPKPAPRGTADLATRHAQELAEIDARHARERAALQTKQEKELGTTDAAQRTQIQQRHTQEMNALQKRQKAEREAIQKRQQQERKEKGSEPQ